MQVANCTARFVLVTDMSIQARVRARNVNERSRTHLDISDDPSDIRDIALAVAAFQRNEGAMLVVPA